MATFELVQAYPQPEWDAALSLPANLSTAMLLVDYALHGYETPTPWPYEVLGRMSEGARRDLEAVEALLAHGAILREYTLERIPAGEAPHASWPAFRAWLEGRSETELDSLLSFGIASGLRWYRRHLDPHAEMERWLESLGTREPDEPILAAVLADPARRKEAAGALLAGWHGTVPDDALHLALRPTRLREVLLRFLDELWEQGLGSDWEARRAELGDVAESVRTRPEARGVPLGGDELVLRVTGLQPTAGAAEELRRAGRIVFVPCLYLGSYLSVLDLAGTRYVLYEPCDRAVAAVGDRKKPGDGRSVRVAALEELAPLAEALGDATRLAILMRLSQGDELYSQQIIDALGVHQSTVSRNLAQLEKVGLVSSDRDGNLKRYRLERGRVREFLGALAETIG